MNKVQLQRTLTTLESSGTKTLQLHPLMLGGELVHQAEEAQHLDGAEGNSPKPTAQGTGRRWGACRSSLQLHITAVGSGPEPGGPWRFAQAEDLSSCPAASQAEKWSRQGACLVAGCSTTGMGWGWDSCFTAAFSQTHCRQTAWLHRASAAACSSTALQKVTGSLSWV